MKQYLNTIKIPIILAVANVFPGNLLYSLLPDSLGLGVYNLFRFGNVFFAGWLITKKKREDYGRLHYLVHYCF